MLYDAPGSLPAQTRLAFKERAKLKIHRRSRFLAL